MKILKPGKVETRKFVCPFCGCIFAASENEIEYNFRTGKYETICPYIECGEHIETSDAEPYEEPTPTQNDEARLAELLRGHILVPSGHSNRIAEYLIENGVTFKETS